MQDDNTIGRGAKVCLAVDFGAGSGRVIAGEEQPDGGLRLEEIHRFCNRPIRLNDTLYWDFPWLYAEMCAGIRKAVDKGYQVLSVGVDTWGVDFGLITGAGNLLSNPLCYRDSHTEGLPQQLCASGTLRLQRFQETGVLPNAINTLYQLVALKRREPSMLEQAARLLFMPDLFSYFLTGEETCEHTIASTSELLFAGKPEWNFPLIRALGLPEHLFGEIVPAGTVKGAFLSSVARRLGLGAETVVVAVGSHDTASAVYASSASHKDSKQAFLSSGTWSLLGKEISKPICSKEAFIGGYTNEAGVGGSTCLLQNIPGMWILQNLVKKWGAQGLFCGYDALMTEADKSGIKSFIDVDAPEFVAPEDMEEAIATHCERHGLPVPRTIPEFVCVAMKSLARRYGKAIEAMNAVLPESERPQSINVVGGGCRNQFLNRLTSEYTGLNVTAGPVEASAIGNLLLQFRSLKDEGRIK